MRISKKAITGIVLVIAGIIAYHCYREKTRKTEFVKEGKEREKEKSVVTGTAADDIETFFGKLRCPGEQIFHIL